MTGDRAPRRVLFMTNPWAFQCPGGGERILIEARAELMRRGLAVDLFDPWRHRIDEYDLVHYFHCPGWETWERIKRLGHRLVVTPTFWVDAPDQWRLLREARHAAHRLVSRWWAPPIDERDARHHLLMPDLLLPASDAEADLLHTWLAIPRERMLVVRNAVAIDAPPAPLPPEVLAPLAAGARALCVGSVHPVKNQLGLIRALRDTPHRVIFIGSRYVDDTSGYRERCIAEGGDRHVFLPEQPHGVVLEAMRRAAVYVQPSLRETCGLAALEAGGLGCPVAVTSRGATREYFGSFATYLDPEDASSIARAVDEALARGRPSPLAEHVRANYTWKVVGDQLEAAYHLVMRRPGRVP